MSVADPFTALGAGNGFPFCLGQSDPGISGQVNAYTDLTQAQLMHLYWNIESVRIAFDIDISFTFWSDDTDPGSGANYNVNLAVDETFGLGGGLLASSPAPAPKDRVCENPIFIGPNLYEITGTSDGLAYRVTLDHEIPLDNPEFGAEEKRWWQSGDVFNLTPFGGYSLLFYFGGITSDSAGGISLFTPSASRTLKETKNFTAYINEREAYFGWSDPEGITSGHQTQYISHTWNSIGVELGFHTYS